MNLSQKRSKYALEKLSEIQGEITNHKEYGSYTSGLPSMVLSNGLAQSFAFILGKKKQGTPEMKVIDWTIEWLGKQDLIKKTTNHRDFMKEISSMPQSQYLASQKECLLLWEWIKRYANSNLFFDDKGEQ